MLFLATPPATAIFIGACGAVLLYLYCARPPEWEGRVRFWGGWREWGATASCNCWVVCEIMGLISGCFNYQVVRIAQYLNIGDVLLGDTMAKNSSLYTPREDQHAQPAQLVQPAQAVNPAQPGSLDGKISRRGFISAGAAAVGLAGLAKIAGAFSGLGVVITQLAGCGGKDYHTWVMENNVRLPGQPGFLDERKSCITILDRYMGSEKFSREVLNGKKKLDLA